MIKRIDLIMPPYSRYEVLHHFTRALADGLSRSGVRTRLLEAEGKDPQPFLDKILGDAPDCTLAFNGLLPDKEGLFLSDLLHIPHVACLVDSPHYFLPLIRSSYSIITCVDKFACDFFQGVNFQNVLFMPHGVDRNLLSQVPPPNAERPYDVVLLASYTDHAAIEREWNQQYGEAFAQALLEAAETVLTDREIPYAPALAKALDHYAKKMGGFDPSRVDFLSVLTQLENYIRGKDRTTLLGAIRSTKVHVFGENSHRWKERLPNAQNIVTHEPVHYQQALEIMKQSKIVLNSSPFFKYGGHERIFTGIALGAAVMTSDNMYLHEIFKHKESILFYHYGHLDEVDGCIKEYVQDNSKRQKLVAKGTEIVRNGHTWDHRAAVLLNELGPILEKIRTK